MIKVKEWCVYMLRCVDGSRYTGITTDLLRRLIQHNEGKASKYTRSRLPTQLVYQEMAKNRSRALRREAEIKRMSKEEKDFLISVYLQRRYSYQELIPSARS